jgi:predicted DNA-binding transcriptional regulator YafY
MRLERLRKLMLTRGGGTTLQEIAVALEVSPRSARRYLERFQSDFELEQVPSPSRASSWRVKAIERPRKIGLRRAQCYALLATRRLFEPMRGSALFDEIDEAVRDLVTLANRPGRGPNAGLVDTEVEERFVHLPAEPANYAARADDVDVFYHAVADLHPVDCRHHPIGGDERGLTLHPYAMVLYQDAIYVVAAEPGQTPDDAMAFPLDELHDATLRPSERFALPSGFHLRRYYQGRFGLFPSTRKTRIVVDFEPRAAARVRHRQVHPSQRLSNLRSGGLRLTLQVDDVERVAQWVLGFGSGARVIEPDSLRQLVMQELKAALSLYRDRGSTEP